MSWDEKDKQTHIKTLQSLQRDINFYKKFNENNQNPSLEKIIDTLRNSALGQYYLCQFSLAFMSSK
jgi:hypothetical protein